MKNRFYKFTTLNKSQYTINLDKVNSLRLIKYNDSNTKLIISFDGSNDIEILYSDKCIDHIISIKDEIESRLKMV